LLGDAAFLLERVMTCLTVTPDVVEEAVREKAQLIVSHHPILFRAAKKITAQTPDGKLILPLARAGVAVYSPHTAFDNCPGGINDILCRRLGMTAVRPLRDREAPPQYKLVVFVPDADLSNVSDAVFAAGGGVIGQYRECSYRLQGTGTFFGTDSTNPTVGQKGRREEVAEWRLEVVVPQQALSTVLTAMRKAHSYEEPAFDVYPLKAGFSGGEGRLGELNEALLLGQFVDRVKTSLGAKAVHYVGDANRPVRRVALACGAAGEFLSDSMRANADVFLTGELRFHDALTARTNGIGVVLPGHYATERPAIEELAKKIAGDWPGLRIWPSRVECDPLTSSDA
jgi:dinuclear metal center YbgI/SA1388 family protein